MNPLIKIKGAYIEQLTETKFASRQGPERAINLDPYPPLTPFVRIFDCIRHKIHLVNCSI